MNKFSLKQLNFLSSPESSTGGFRSTGSPNSIHLFPADRLLTPSPHSSPPLRADLKDIKVHLGEYDTKDTGFYPEPYPSAVRSVAEVRINPRFHYMLTQPDR